MPKERKHMVSARGCRLKTDRPYSKEEGAKAEKPSHRNMKKCGLSTKERLKRPLQFKNAYQQRKAAKSTLLWLYRVPNSLAYNRLGISVSNRLCDNIVQRNKIKRIIRQIFQHNKQSFGQGMDIVAVIKRKPQAMDYNHWEKLILGLSKK